MQIFPLDDDAEALRQQRLKLDLPRIETLSVAQARAQLDALRAAAPAPQLAPLHEMRDLDAGSIRVRLYRPTEGTLPVIVFVHGGGWVLRTVEDYDPFCSHLARITGHAVISVDYRLAPEHPYPAGLEDTCATITWVAEHAASLQLDAGQMVLAGDSAGANLVAVAALRAKDGEGHAPRAQVLFYPTLDATQSHASHSFEMDGLLLSGKTMTWFSDLYCTPAQRSDWQVSPLLADRLEGVAPALIMTVGADPLRDEGLAYADRLMRAGVEVSHVHYPGQPHAFLTMVPDSARVQSALRTTAALLDEMP